MAYLLASLVTLVAVLVIRKIWEACWRILWRPYVLTKSFEKQGIRGPAYRPPYGSIEEVKQLRISARERILDTNSNEIDPIVSPHFHKWTAQYGETILYWWGTEPSISTSDPKLAKEILSSKFGFYTKLNVPPTIKKLVGSRGLVLVEGLDWVRHRRILNPAFSVDKLKVMVKKMADCAISKLDGWENQALEAENQCRKIEMSREFMELTADIIAHTVFGSSYVQGKEVFNAQEEIQKHFIAAQSNIFIPGRQYLPTPSNRRIWKLDRQMKNLLRGIIESRIKAKASSYGGYGDDLLGLMIESSAGDPKLNLNEIIDNCKTFFFAGRETTSNLLTWTVFLLSLHQDWQEKLRKEVLKECGMAIPDPDLLPKLKLMNMVLLETLRLYCPVTDLARKAVQDMKLGNLMIPKDTTISISITRMHRSKENWGEDANEFNPLRFANGVSKATKYPNAFLAFSMGPRSCIGQNFAMLEARTAVALILQRFSFSLSSEYKHAPFNHLTLRPLYGLPVIMKPLCTNI